MRSNFSITLNEAPLGYPILTSHLAFSDYLKECHALIKNRRLDIYQPGANADLIIDANMPYEYYPPHENGGKKKLIAGALLIHGLLDSPFSLRDIGKELQAQGLLCRSILLPGHGTVPDDLRHVLYEHWVEAVQYGIENLRKEVEHIFLVGYSTGAALALHAAFQKQFAGIILIAPAVKIKAPVGLISDWELLARLFNSKNNLWLYREKENDYTKYHSIAFNPVHQVSRLTQALAEFVNNEQPLTTPMFMVLCREDETISSYQALRFFQGIPTPNNQLLMYTSNHEAIKDPRMIIRHTIFTGLAINHFSHVSLPFAPLNMHYGQHGDYSGASRLNSEEYIYGAYNALEKRFSEFLFSLGLIKQKRQELTYNPDFDFMIKKMTAFVGRQLHST